MQALGVVPWGLCYFRFIFFFNSSILCHREGLTARFSMFLLLLPIVVLAWLPRPVPLPVIPPAGFGDHFIPPCVCVLLCKQL